MKKASNHFYDENFDESIVPLDKSLEMLKEQIASCEKFWNRESEDLLEDDPEDVRNGDFDFGVSVSSPMLILEYRLNQR